MAAMLTPYESLGMLMIIVDVYLANSTPPKKGYSTWGFQLYSA